MKRLLGNAVANRLMAWPCPQPMSARSMPEQSICQAGHQRKDLVDQRCVMNRGAVLGHQLLKRR